MRLRLVGRAALAAVGVTLDDLPTALGGVQLILTGDEVDDVCDHGLDAIEGLPDAIHIFIGFLNLFEF